MARYLSHIPKRKAISRGGHGLGSAHGIDLQQELVALRAQMEALPDRLERFAPFDRTIHGVRRVATRSHTGNVGKMRSTRFCRVEYESPLERDFLLIAHGDPRITKIISQPLTLQWADGDGVVRQHTPDFALLREGLLIIVELKSDDDAKTPRSWVVPMNLSASSCARHPSTSSGLRPASASSRCCPTCTPALGNGVSSEEDRYRRRPAPSSA